MRTIGTMAAVDDQHGVVRVEDVYDTDVDDLWQACTTPDRMARWIGEVSGDLRVGGTVEARLTSTWAGPVRIEECEPPRHLRVTMAPGTDEETRTEAWLTAEGGRTRLVVEEQGLPLSHLHYYGAGWQAHLEDLERSLRDEPSAWKERWDELTPVYEAMGVGWCERS